MSDELPFGIKTRPHLRRTRHVDVAVDDHLGKSTVALQEWANGEGFTVSVFEHSENRELELTHSQITALRMCLKEMKKSDKG